MNKCRFKVADQCHWSTPTRQRQKELTHSVCRFFLRRTPHPAACECSSSQQPAARRRWLKFPSRCLRGRWPPWHTRPDTGALRTNDTQCCQDEDANPKQWKARHIKHKNKKTKKNKNKTHTQASCSWLEHVEIWFKVEKLFKKRGVDSWHKKQLEETSYKSSYPLVRRWSFVNHIDETERKQKTVEI